MSKSDDIKKTYLSMLMQISNADGNFSADEERYLDIIAAKLDIPYDELTSIKENPIQNNAIYPDTYSERIEFFYNLLFMMGIDQTISKEETELCKQIGFKLCFNPMLMDDLISIVTENVGKKIPVDDVIKAVIKYQN